MFGFKKKMPALPSCSLSERVEQDETDNQQSSKTTMSIATGFTTANSAQVSTQRAAKTFAKPAKYDRKLYDDGSAKLRAKRNAFAAGDVRDPYGGQSLELRIKDAKLKYGKDWAKHVAEADHKVPIKQVYDESKNNPWLSNADIKRSANSDANIEVTSRQHNNAKRDRSAEDFVTDDAYLKKTGVVLSDDAKQKAIRSSKKAQAAIKRQNTTSVVKNVVKTGHEAGMRAAHDTAITAATMSSITNIVAVIKGEKDIDEALVDTAMDTGKAAATSYVAGGGLTTIAHTLSNSKSEFIQALTQSNVPGKIITAVMVTGDALKKYANGEISTQECIIEIGEKGLTCATAGYSMAVGQALIPIPVIGAAIGAMIGASATNGFYNRLVNELKTKELERKERQRLINECTIYAQELRAYRLELESYLQDYFRDYRNCFDSALSAIRSSLVSDDVDGVIAGANQITYRLGGRVSFDNIKECRQFMASDNVDIL